MTVDVVGDLDQMLATIDEDFKDSPEMISLYKPTLQTIKLLISNAETNPNKEMQDLLDDSMETGYNLGRILGYLSGIKQFKTVMIKELKKKYSTVYEDEIETAGKEEKK